MNSTEEPQLLRLRIPAGWHVRYNELREIEPEKLGQEDPMWVYMNQDLMQIESTDGEPLLIDVGWYPDNSPQGHYGIKCIVETDWARPVATFHARTQLELVERLESLFARPPAFPVQRLMERVAGGLSEQRCAAAEELANRGAIEAIDAISAAMKAEHIRPVYERLGAARKRLIQKRVRDQGE